MLTPTEARRRVAAYDAQLDCSPQELDGRRRQRAERRAEIDAIKRLHRRMDLSPASRAELDRRDRDRMDADYIDHVASLLLKDPLTVTEVDLNSLPIQQRLQLETKIIMARAVHGAQAMTVVPFPAAAPRKLILSDAEFTEGFVPPEYLLDGILQRRFCYALTAQTGAGKTAIALRLAAHVGLGRKLGDKDVEQGRVLYFASENAVDVQARWIAMAQHCGFEIGKTDVHFVSGATRLSEIADRITAEAAAIGDLALVIVDTSAATFEGDDENSNVHAIEHAKRMRGLTALRGGPTVLVLAHPTKRAAADDLIPRGGGAFLAEIDGNLCARKADSAVEVHWAGKFRGMDFVPMMFRLDTVVAERLKDRRGRNIPTVMASPLDEATRAAMEASGRRDEDDVLRVIEKRPGASLADLAKALNWTYGRDGRPHKMKVKRAIGALIGAKLVVEHRGAWAPTPKGQQELNALDRHSVVTPAAPRSML